jgi:hypothetical protein
MDYLHDRRDEMQDALAARHLAGGTLVLYDVSSAASGGRTCPLGVIGHPKGGVRGRLQIVYGLLTSKDGIPVAIEVFAGNTGDPATVAAQVTKLKDRFGITRVVLVGDRGMLTAMTGHHVAANVLCAAGADPPENGFRAWCWAYRQVVTYSGLLGAVCGNAKSRHRAGW